MPIAEGLALPLQRLALQRLSAGEVALGPQQRAEVVDGDERVWIPVAEGLARHLQRLAKQRLGGGEVALGKQQRAEAADEVERVWMPIAEGRERHLQRLAIQRLGLVELALGIQLRGERVQGEACGLAIRALGLEPCTQKFEAQRIAVPVHALAAAVGCVLPRGRAPPLLEAVFMDPLGGATACTRLHERPVVFITPAKPAHPLLRYHFGCERRPCWSRTPAQELRSDRARRAYACNGAIIVGQGVAVVGVLPHTVFLGVLLPHTSGRGTPCNGCAAVRARRSCRRRTPCRCCAAGRARRSCRRRTPCRRCAAGRARRCRCRRTPCRRCAPA
eukprot:scaffold39858_cov59-Phaeocystis_antarctica.AAC.1